MKIFTTFLTYTLLLLSAALLNSCGEKTEEVAETEEHHKEEENTIEFSDEQYKTAGIEVGAVEIKQISGTIKVNGQLDVPPQQMVSVSAPLGGFLKETPLLQGTHVNRGQVIATIENLDFVQLQQDYLDAKNQFEFAEKDFERQTTLAKEEVAAQKTLQQAKTTYESWKTRTNALREKLRILNIDTKSAEDGKITGQINLYSPINGYVTQVNVNIGKFVNPSDILFEIVDTEHLHAELTVFEKDVPKLKIGQKVRFTLANETRERMATVYLIGREIAADRTIRIHCHIDKEDRNLLPGMYLKALVETGGLEVPALPDDAIIDFQGGKYIFYELSDQPHSAQKGEDKKDHEDEHHFVMLAVEVGNSEMGFTEIVLPEDFPLEKARIVIKNAYSILSKMKNSEEEEDHH